MIEPALYADEQTFLPQSDAAMTSVSASRDEIAQLQQLMTSGDMDWSGDWSWVYNSPFFHQPQSMTDGLSPHANEMLALDDTPRIFQPPEYHHGGAQASWTSLDSHPAGASSSTPVVPAGVVATISKNSSSITAALPETTEMEIQQNVIESHVEFAVANVGTPSSTEELALRTRARREGAVKAANAFGLQNLDSLSHDSRDALDRFVSLFFEKFHPHCPIFREQSFDSYEVSPIIFLSIICIGARYAGSKAAHYGEMLHARLQTLFLSTVITQSQVEHKDIFLVFGVLITIAQMHLGREDAFSHAQHLSSILVVQARKLGLFQLCSPLERQATEDPDRLLNDWFDMEMKKRLAFAIFRTEAYLSTLYHTRPVVSVEEMHIELPCADFIWTAIGHDARRRALQAIEDSSRVQQYTFADLVQIAMDRNEVLPTLDAQDHEYLLLALQEKISRFSQGPALMSVSRPTGSAGPVNAFSHRTMHGSTYLNNQRDSLMGNSPLRNRQMADSLSDLDRILSAINSWKDLQPPAPHVPELRQGYQRTYLRSRVVFHSIHLRLNTPTELINELAMTGSPLCNIRPDALRKICHWSCSDHAQVALSHAQALYVLLQQAPKDPKSIQSNFDLSYVMAITHAALVLWAMAGSRGVQARGLWEVNWVIPEALFNGHLVNTMNLERLLQGLQKLLAELTPSWFIQPLFGMKLTTLLKTSFPYSPCLHNR
jgi:hypothetical protein